MKYTTTHIRDANLAEIKFAEKAPASMQTNRIDGRKRGKYNTRLKKTLAVDDLAKAVRLYAVVLYRFWCTY